MTLSLLWAIWDSRPFRQGSGDGGGVLLRRGLAVEEQDRSGLQTRALAGGGGGSSNVDTGLHGFGGTGGGGNGAGGGNYRTTAGLPNTGSGGGGVRNSGDATGVTFFGGSGGSGIVIISIPRS